MMFAVVFSPSGTEIAAAGNDRTCRVWNTAELLKEARSKQDGLKPGTVSVIKRKQLTSKAHGGASASASAGTGTYNYSMSTGHQSGTTGNDLEDVDAAIVASLVELDDEGDKAIQVWRRRQAIHAKIARTEAEVCYFQHISPIFALAFSADGSVVAAGSGDGKLRLWSVSSRPSTAMLCCVLTAHEPRPLLSLAFSPCNTRIATGGDDKTVRIWRARND